MKNILFALFMASLAWFPRLAAFSFILSKKRAANTRSSVPDSEEEETQQTLVRRTPSSTDTLYKELDCALFASRRFFCSESFYQHRQACRLPTR